MSFKWEKLKTFSVQFIIHIINWIIIVFFAILISFVNNKQDALNTYRPNLRLITGSVYMMVVLSSTCILCIIMKIKISKSINDLLDPQVFKINA